MKTHAVSSAATKLVEHLSDKRSKQVVFLSHCILNENTRYLGGACRVGCIPEIVQQCVENNLGMVQMPCPEQQVWGGVLKRYMLSSYGLKQRHPLIYRFRRVLLHLALLYTRFRYRRIARGVSRQIEDYLSSGYVVTAVIGVDGSPSCGVTTTINLSACDRVFGISLDTISPSTLNATLRASATPGMGIFVDELQKELQRRRVFVSFRAHDLWRELDGEKSNVVL